MLWTVRLSPPTAKLLLAAADSWNRRPSPPPAPELMRLAEAWVARVTAILAHGAPGTAHEAKAAFTAALGRPGQGDEWQPMEAAPIGKTLMFWWRPIDAEKRPWAGNCTMGHICYDDHDEPTGQWYNVFSGLYQSVWHLVAWRHLPPSPPDSAALAATRGETTAGGG